MLLKMNPLESLVLSNELVPVTCADLSPDDRVIVTGDLSGSVKLWSVSELRLDGVVSRHEGPITGVGFVGGASRFYSAGLDGIVRFYDRATNVSFELPRMDPITASDVASDGSIAVTGESRRGIMESGWRENWWHFGDIVGCISGSVNAWPIGSLWRGREKTRRSSPLWSINLEDHKVDLAAGNPSCPSFVRISPDLRMAAFIRAVGGTNPGELELVRLADGAQLFSRWGTPSTRPVAVVFDADSRRMIIVTMMGLLLQEISLETMEGSTIQLEEPPSDPIDAFREAPPWWAPRAVRGSAGGSLLLLGSRKGAIHLYDVPNRRLITTLAGHTEEVTAVEFFSDLRHVLSTGMDSTIRIWKLPRIELE